MYHVCQYIFSEEKEEPKMEFQAFKNKIWLSSPTMHGEELKYVTEAYETNWMSTGDANINEIIRHSETMQTRLR